MVLALCAILNTAFEFIGINAEVLSALSGMSLLPLLFFYLASYAFKFCQYHRMFLHYILANNVITWFDYWIGIPVSTMTLLAIHISLIGLLLFLVLYFHQKECCK